MEYASQKAAYLILSILFISNITAAQSTWTLRDCINHALQKNIALNTGITNNQLNKILLEQSEANRLPNLNLTDQHNLLYGKPVDPATGRYRALHSSVNDLALSSSITIFNGLRNNNLIRENRLNRQAGDLDIEKLKNDLMLNVLAAYTQLLFAYDAISIAQAQIDITTEHLLYTEKYVRAGSLPESNLLQMKAQLAADNASRVNAENQMQMAKVVLMQLIELPVDSEFSIERPEMETIIPDPSSTPSEIYRTAASWLPEIASATIRTNAARYALRIASAGMVPKLTLSGSLLTSYSNALSLVSYSTSTTTSQIGYLGRDPSESVYGPVSTTTATNSKYPFARQFGDNFSQNIGITLSIPIFNNRQYITDVERSKIAIQVAMFNQDATKNQLRKNIEQAYADQLAASKTYVATKQQLQAEERSYRDITARFRAGTLNITDFFVEKNNYAKAQLTALQAEYEYLFKSKVVNFYLGKPVTE